MLVLLAASQALMREGLKRITLQVEATCEFVEVTDALAARSAMHVDGTAIFDAAWFDASYFGPGEIAALRHDQPALLLLALNEREDEAAAARLLAAGVNAVVPQSASSEILAAVLRLAMSGNVCVRGNKLGHTRALASFIDRLGGASKHGTGPLNLTKRQYDVVGLIANGCSNKDIAAELGIGLRTVKGHVSVILRALHADNRTDAGRAARRWLARAANMRPVISGNPPVLPPFFATVTPSMTPAVSPSIKASTTPSTPPSITPSVMPSDAASAAPAN